MIDEWITAKEAQRRAGVRCRETIYRWRRDGVIEGRQAGRELLVRANSLDNALEARAARRPDRRKKPGPKPDPIGRRRRRVVKRLAAGWDVDRIARAEKVSAATVYGDIRASRDALEAAGVVLSERRPRRALPEASARSCPDCGRTYTPRPWRFVDGFEQVCPTCARRSPADDHLTRSEQLELAISVYLVGRVIEQRGQLVRIPGTLSETAARIGCSPGRVRTLLREAGLPIRPPVQRSISRAVKTECAVCSDPIYVYPSQLRKGRRRHFCAAHFPLWRSALSRAYWAVNGAPATFCPRTQQAFLEAYAVGKEFEEESLQLWPRDRGRRPPLAVDLAIEAMHVWAKCSDGVVTMIIDALLASDEIAIPGVRERVNDRYVTRRREIARIKRPIAA